MRAYFSDLSPSSKSRGIQVTSLRTQHTHAHPPFPSSATYPVIDDVLEFDERACPPLLRLLKLHSLPAPAVLHCIHSESLHTDSCDIEISRCDARHSAFDLPSREYSLTLSSRCSLSKECRPRLIVAFG